MNVSIRVCFFFDEVFATAIYRDKHHPLGVFAMSIYRDKHHRLGVFYCRCRLFWAPCVMLWATWEAQTPSCDHTW